MAGDVDEAVLARHERARVAAGALLQRLVIGPVDEHHLQADAADRRSGRSRCPGCSALPEPRSLPSRSPPLCGEVDRRSCVGRNAASCRSAAREPTLLPVRVDRREGVLPVPDSDRPGERQDARDDHQACREIRAARRISAVLTRAGRSVRAPPSAREHDRRTSSRSGPRGAALGGVRVRGVAPADERRQLRRAGRPGEADRRTPAAGHSRARRAPRCTKGRPSRARSGRRTTRASSRARASPASTSAILAQTGFRAQLGQPEPDVERRQHEQERERVGRDDDERDRRRARAGRRCVRRALSGCTGRRGSRRCRATSQPSAMSTREAASATTGQSVAAGESRATAAARAARPDAGEREEAEAARRGEPEARAGCGSSRSAGREPDPAPAAAREEVDGGGEEGEERARSARARSPSRGRSGSPRQT